MIEVEKKFILREDDKGRLTQGAEFLSERSFTDTYYDSSDYGLTTHDKWLRSRNGKFELKSTILARELASVNLINMKN